MQKEFLQHIRSHSLIPENKNVLLAVSGGVDSMVMIHLFGLSNIPFGVAHINHQLRGVESIQDMDLVKKYCDQQNIPFFIETIKKGSLESPNIQEKARDIRYSLLTKIADKYGYFHIATAHHLDDELETVFMNFMRGTGLEGLTGIPKKNGNIIRPLLFTTKEELLKYAKKHQIPYRDDSSNFSEKYTRNAVRNNVLPEFDKIDYRKRKGFYHSIHQLQKVQSLVDNFIAIVKKEVLSQNGQIFTIDIQKINQYKDIDTILFYVLKDFGFNATQVQDMIKSTGFGAKFESEAGTLVIETNTWNLYLNSQTDKQPLELNIDRLPFETEAGGSLWQLQKIETLPDRNQTGINISKISFPLTIRPWKSGDIFYPLTMKGKKKDIKNILSELKIPIFLRKKQKVLVDGSGEIVAVLPHQISFSFATYHSPKGYLDIYENGISLLYKAEDKPA